MVESTGSSCGVTGPICWISAAPASVADPDAPGELPPLWLPATPCPLPSVTDCELAPVTPRNGPPDSARSTDQFADTRS